jgi:tRNA (guanine-N7-)-methyltransferase
VYVHPSPPSPTHLAAKQSRIASLRKQLEEQLAGRSAITLEIGSGHGHFLTGYAAARPDRFCVGIDIILDRWERSERKRGRAGLENLTFLRAEAREFVEALPPGVLLTEIFILFPDPWPKRRHHKNRIIQSEFLTTLALRCEAGSSLYFRTDHDEYFAAAREVIRSHAHWEIQPGAPWPFELPTVFQTRAPAYQSLVASRRAEVPSGGGRVAP